jgi:hypothetical protein
MNCGFTTFQQCLATVSEAGFCIQNNTYQPPPGSRRSTRIYGDFPYYLIVIAAIAPAAWRYWPLAITNIDLRNGRVECKDRGNYPHHSKDEPQRGSDAAMINLWQGMTATGTECSYY